MGPDKRGYRPKRKISASLNGGRSRSGPDAVLALIAAPALIGKAGFSTRRPVGFSDLALQCAQFCAPSPSQTIASGHSRAGKHVSRFGAQNQDDSKQSHSVLIVFGRTLNQRVAGSSPARFTTLL